MKNDVQSMEFFMLVFFFFIYEGGSTTLQQLVFDLKFSWYNVKKEKKRSFNFYLFFGLFSILNGSKIPIFFSFYSKTCGAMETSLKMMPENLVEEFMLKIVFKWNQK